MMRARKPADPEALLKRMAGLCAKSEQCSFDISTKLYRAGLPREKQEEIMEYLIANRYVDDARFARSFTNYKVRFAAWGRRKIRAALAAKRIPSSLVAAALESIDPEEYAAALSRALAAASAGLNPAVYDDRAKIYRRLLARGFEPGLISNALSES
ncbi:MAG: RecX family transcriptional regulator [Muribaculaceae bacterium]|nr:RecX family transcriptional regulator [Muribaculaceae bacterium]